MGGGAASERGPGPVSKGTGSCRRGRPGSFGSLGALTRLEGSRGPLSRWRWPPGRRRHADLRGPSGSQAPRCGRRRLQRGRTPGEQRPAASGRLEADVNGLAEGNEASKRVKPAERVGLIRRCPRGSGKRRCGGVESDLLGVRGARQARESAGVGETRGDKARRVRRSTTVNDRKGAERPREGCALFGEGKALKERKPTDGSGTKQGREARAC